MPQSANGKRMSMGARKGKHEELLRATGKGQGGRDSKLEVTTDANPQADPAGILQNAIHRKESAADGVKTVGNSNKGTGAVNVGMTEGILVAPGPVGWALFTDEVCGGEGGRGSIHR